MSRSRGAEAGLEEPGGPVGSAPGPRRHETSSLPSGSHHWAAGSGSGSLPPPRGAAPGSPRSVMGPISGTEHRRFPCTLPSAFPPLPPFSLRPSPKAACSPLGLASPPRVCPTPHQILDEGLQPSGNRVPLYPKDTAGPTQKEPARQPSPWAPWPTALTAPGQHPLPALALLILKPEVSPGGSAPEWAPAPGRGADATRSHCTATPATLTMAKKWLLTRRCGPVGGGGSHALAVSPVREGTGKEAGGGRGKQTRGPSPLPWPLLQVALKESAWRGCSHPGGDGKNPGEGGPSPEGGSAETPTPQNVTWVCSLTGLRRGAPGQLPPSRGQRAHPP